MGTARKGNGNDLTFGSDGTRSTEKLRELVLYIADKCEEDRTFGAVKLNKILFYADFISFAEYGEPITGVSTGSLKQALYQLSSSVCDPRWKRAAKSS